MALTMTPMIIPRRPAESKSPLPMALKSCTPMTRVVIAKEGNRSKNTQLSIKVVMPRCRLMLAPWD